MLGSPSNNGVRGSIGPTECESGDPKEPGLGVGGELNLFTYPPALICLNFFYFLEKKERAWKTKTHIKINENPKQTPLYFIQT